MLIARLGWWVAWLIFSWGRVPRSEVVELAAAIAIAMTARAVLASVVSFMVGAASGVGCAMMPHFWEVQGDGKLAGGVRAIAAHCDADY